MNEGTLLQNHQIILYVCTIFMVSAVNDKSPPLTHECRVSADCASLGSHAHKKENFELVKKK